MRRPIPQAVACLCGAVTVVAAAVALTFSSGAPSAIAQSLTPPTTASSGTSTAAPSGTSPSIASSDADVAPTNVPPWSAQVVDSNDVAKALSRSTSTAIAGATTTTTAKPKAKKKAAVASTTTVAVAAVALSATLGATGANGAAAPIRASADDPAVWAALRACESGGRYDLNSGNGYYGAYQFALSTWQKLGYPGYPHEAPAAMQDEAANKLQDKQGWGPWPACARRIGAR